MTSRPAFDNFSGPGATIDRMIGEEYLVIKAVALKIPELAEILASIQSIQDFDVLMTALLAARDAAALSATDADTSEAQTLVYKNATDAFRAQAQAFATAALASELAAALSKVAAAASANAANNSAISAGSSQSASAASAILANAWATRTNAEVVAGQGYGAKKYAIDAANSALAADGSADAAEVARLAAVDAKNDAVAIAGFDVSLYATKEFAKKQAKRSAMIFGS